MANKEYVKIAVPQPRPGDMFCTNCGGTVASSAASPAQPAASPMQSPQMQQPQPQQMQGYKRVERKKPWLAALIGILVVGFGYFYLGEWLKGILLIIVTIIISILTAFSSHTDFWIISCLWAYYDAKAYNRKARILE